MRGAKVLMNGAAPPRVNGPVEAMEPVTLENVTGAKLGARVMVRPAKRRSVLAACSPSYSRVPFMERWMASLGLWPMELGWPPLARPQTARKALFWEIVV